MVRISELATCASGTGRTAGRHLQSDLPSWRESLLFRAIDWRWTQAGIGAGWGSSTSPPGHLGTRGEGPGWFGQRSVGGWVPKQIGSAGDWSRTRRMVWPGLDACPGDRHDPDLARVAQTARDTELSLCLGSRPGGHEHRQRCDGPLRPDRGQYRPKGPCGCGDREASRSVQASSLR